MSRSRASRSATTSEIGGKSQCGDTSGIIRTGDASNTAQRAYTYPGATCTIRKNKQLRQARPLRRICVRLKLLLLRVYTLDIFFAHA